MVFTLSAKRGDTARAAPGTRLSWKIACIGLCLACMSIVWSNTAFSRSALPFITAVIASAPPLTLTMCTSRPAFS